MLKGEQYDLSRVYTRPTAPMLMPGDQLAGYDESGLAIVRRGLGTTYGITLRGHALNPLLPKSSLFPPTRTPIDAETVLKDPQFQSQFGGLSSEIQSGLANLESRYQAPPSSLSLPGSIRSVITEEAGQSPIGQGTTMSFQMQRTALIPYGQILVELERSAAISRQQIEADVRRIEGYNAPIHAWNERITSTLVEVTGLALGPERAKWTDWYVDQLGYRSRVASTSDRKPAFVTEVFAGELPPFPVPVEDVVLSHTRMSCFGVGTPVHTPSGLVPIEQIAVGDLVLSMDTDTGGLSYEPVLVVHHNPPGATTEVTAGGETITASVFHRFWRAGRGWAMARDLSEGDRLRSLAGTAAVESVTSGAEQPVYNLDVAGGRSFFVGEAGLLVHDNSLPNLRAEPFDRPGEFARAGD